ncbi:MAG: DMT family transporter [Bacteroidales bacterium]|nr:DMT family transporter [Bacteroidales bacterium]
MWLALAFLSAALLGLYDTAKKAALKDNAVIPVLFLNTVFSTLIFSPFIISSLRNGVPLPSEGITPLKAHLMTIAKSCIVLTSWLFGYFGLKHLPITIVGPINATRPILVLLGAMILFGERLNLWQWGGVILAMFSLLLLSRSSKKENVDFVHNKWIWFIAISAITGACSGLYDKYIMRFLDATFVQGWYNFYQMVLMGIMMLILWLPNRSKTTPFHWSWAILMISIFISAADFAYLTALRQSDSMISVVSLVRRSSVIVSFLCGAIIFKERNLKAKALDLAFILVGMILIWIGSR